MINICQRFWPYENIGRGEITDLPCVGMAHDPVFYRPREISGTIAADEVPTVMALDPSGGSDEFAWAVVKAWAGNYYLVEAGGRLGGVSDAFWTQIAQTAKKHRVNEILVETNFGGLEVYQQVMKPYLVKADAACRIEPVRSNMQKELRIIDTMAPVMQTIGLLWTAAWIEADADLVKNAKDDRDVSYSLYQLTRITHDRGSLLHDDRLMLSRWQSNGCRNKRHKIRRSVPRTAWLRSLRRRWPTKTAGC